MAKSKGRQAELEISQILAAAAHDLRQPMHSLNMLLDALAERAEGAEIASLVNAARVSADGVSGVVEAILGISALHADGSDPDMAEFDIAGLLDHSRDQFAAQATNKGLELRVVPCALRVRSDRLLLQRVLDCLISNAIRHTENGRVLLGCRRLNDMLRIGVLDTGPGLDEQTLARISGSAEQDTSQSKWRGQALRLSIAENLCAALGHEMSVTSDAGTAVRVQLALASTQSETEKPSPAVAQPLRENEAVIVVVEDDPDVYLVTTQHLTDWGYAVFGGASVAEAIEDCEAHAGGRCPDLVLSDFKLPNGQTAVDAIGALNRHFGAKIPAIVVSGDPSAARDVAVEGLESDILQKPVRAAKLRALVRHALENGGK